MARYNLYIGGQVFFECGELWSFAGRLTTDDGADLGCLNPSQNVLGLEAPGSRFDTYITRTPPRPYR